MPNLSASKLALARHCTYWLDAIELKGPGGRVHKRTQDGIDVHAILAPLADRELEPNEEIYPSARALTLANHGAMWLLSQDFKGPVSAELALAWDLSSDTVRVLGKDIARQYVKHGLRPDEFPGSLDLLVEDATGVPTVYDWKTGQPSAYAEDQLNALGTMAAKLVGAPRANVVLLYLDEEGVRPVRRTVGRFEMDETKELIREAGDLMQQRAPRPGPHCFGMYCEERMTCGER